MIIIQIIYTLSLLNVHIFVVANRQLSLDKFQVPAKIAMSSIVPVAMAMTARVGENAVALGKNAFSTVIYISRDDKLDLTDYTWTTIRHTTGRPTDSVTCQGSHFFCLLWKYFLHTSVTVIVTSLSLLSAVCKTKFNCTAYGVLYCLHANKFQL